MPNTQQRVTPRFPAAILGVGAIGVQIAGGVVTISTSADDEINVSQYLRALNIIRPNGGSTLQAAVPANPDDPNRVILDNTRTVPPGGAYETLVISVFGFDTATVTALRAVAALQLP